jgi:hypothetical protein
MAMYQNTETQSIFTLESSFLDSELASRSGFNLLGNHLSLFASEGDGLCEESIKYYVCHIPN